MHPVGRKDRSIWRFLCRKVRSCDLCSWLCGCCLNLSPLTFVVTTIIILISVTCDKEFWSRSSDSVTACFNTLNPSTFNVELVVFWTGTQLFLDWDSWFFLRWVPSLAITTSNKITVTALYKSGTCTCRKQKVIGKEKERAILEKNEKRSEEKWSGSVGLRSRDYQIFLDG